MESISDIQNYFENVLKKHGEKNDNASIRIYVNKIQNRITFKIKNETLPWDLNTWNNEITCKYWK